MEIVDKLGRTGVHEVKEVVGCVHVGLKSNPLLSDIPNIGVVTTRAVVLVVEQQKIKLVCWRCIARIA